MKRIFFSLTYSTHVEKRVTIGWLDIIPAFKKLLELKYKCTVTIDKVTDLTTTTEMALSINALQYVNTYN
jgi:hypothetical protein